MVETWDEVLPGRDAALEAVEYTDMRELFTKLMAATGWGASPENEVVCNCLGGAGSDS